MNESTLRTPKKYDREFKLAALERWRTSGKSQRAVAEELGISEQNLRDWRAAFAARPPAPSNARPRTTAELEAENLRLRRENQSLRNQRDTLIKSLGILSEPLTNGSHS
jgi:transposase